MRYVLPALLVASLAGAALAADSPAQVRVDLKTGSGGSAGVATLTEAPNGVLLRIEVQGLTPGWHGVHFHEKADCSKSDFTSAGGHVHGKPTMVHGLLNPEANEAGDLPNLYVNAQGEGMAEMFSSYVSFAGAASREALRDKDGSALVIHASPDDHKTQPIGGAGTRIACGAITGN